MTPSSAAQKRAASAVDLTDQAFHELRRAPAAALAAYALGSVPFLLVLLYFGADMSSSAFAGGHVGESSLALALLYVGWKLGQTVFVGRLQEGLGEEGLRRWPANRIARSAMIQAAVQPTGLFLLPLAALALLPFPWVLAFYENVTVLGDGRLPLRETVRLSASRARLWPAQNHGVVLILLLFGAIVFFNVAIALLFLPYLVRLFLGVESVFTRSGLGVFNSTFWSAALALTFFLMSPFGKAVYRRRCFEAGAVATGEDLKERWRRLAPRAGRVAGLAACALLLGAGAAAAQPAAQAPRALSPAARADASAAARVSPDDLDRAIRITLRKRAYAWRLPRDARSAADQGWLATQLRRLAEWSGKIGDVLRRWWNSFLDWLRRLFRRQGPRPADGGAGFGWIYSTQALVLVALTAAACALALLVLRRRRLRRAGAPAQPLVARGEPREEDSPHEELADAEWRRRARDFLALGDLRQATRALYLGILAFLAARGAITPARFKSNRDYEREIGRRQRARPPVRELFSQSAATFEAIWYGRHSATPATVELLDQNLERLKEQLEG
jgi:hypothetical protein